MRYLLLSDVHANAHALEAVLQDARRRGWDEAVFLGDAVGYYTQPERSLELLQRLAPRVALLGNHDALLLQLLDGGGEGAGEGGMVVEVLARHAAELSDEAVAYLRTFVEGHCEDGWQAVHGALRRQWEYIATLASAQGNAPQLKRPLCLLGHTHVPKVFAVVEAGGQELWRTVPFRKHTASYRVPPRARAFLNPGSVGQPRDGIPMAAYAILDEASRTFDVYRVEFDILSVQREVRQQNYPAVLATRLAVGK